MPTVDKDIGPVKAVVIQRTRRVLSVTLKYNVPTAAYSKVIVFQETDLDEAKVAITGSQQRLELPDKSLTVDERKRIDIELEAALEQI